MWSLLEVVRDVGLEHALEVPTPVDQDVVEAPEPGRARRPAEHLELMTEDEDLEVPDDVISVTLAADDEETDEGAGDKVDERPHRPIVPGATSTNRGFRPHALALFDTFFRAGALVFGGGHVVLPLLHGAVVDPGWVSNDRFLAGYGAAQAVPGPLFTFAAYLGAVATVSPGWWAGATIALVAIFLPSFLLIFGALPFWDLLRRSSGFRRALAGTNAAVVGILLAALYTPISTSAIGGPADVAVALAAVGLLVLGRVPPILVVALAAIVGQIGA
jgi:chromate transport protein ChrA